MWTFGEANALRRMVGRTYAYHTDTSDEFVVQREDGTVQGIFKVWSVPVIPFLDAGRIDLLSALWPEVLRRAPAKGFSASLHEMEKCGNQQLAARAQKARGIMQRWQERCVRKPEYLARSLERARLYSWIADGRLAERYAEEPLSDELPERITQLVNRLYTAFGLMNPFYHLEVLVDNPRWLCGAESLDGADRLAGRLDAAALLLPAAFRDFVIAETLNWNGLSWDTLKQQVREIFQSDTIRKKILVNLARLTGAPPHHLLFAANALEWIPVRGGGKKRDPVAPHQELVQLSAALAKSGVPHHDVVSVLAETNALIRFLNWLPLIEGGKNFSGQQWTYASVCDTTSQLLQTLYDNPCVWKTEFADVFNRILAPQLQHLDAQSAQGRFLLQLILEEQRLQECYFKGLNGHWQKDAVRSVVSPRSNSELTRPTKKLYPFSLVGGKTFGLSLAAYVAGENHVAGGVPISSSAIEQFLKSDSRLWGCIQKLDQEEDLERKMLLAPNVQVAIQGCRVPGWFTRIVDHGLRRHPKALLWAVRSSSGEEGEARGVYGTELRVQRGACTEAVIACIASYYSKRAVTFRAIIGAGDLPFFSVLLQPYHNHQGGVGSYARDGAEKRCTVSVGASAEDVTSGKEVLREWTGSLQEARYAREDVAEVASILEQLSCVFEEMQVEWVRNPHVTILQMELLGRANGHSNKDGMASKLTIAVDSIDGINNLVQSLSSSDTHLVSIVLGNGVELGQFQDEVLKLCARFGRRIVEVQFETQPSPSSHLANICGYLGIRCTGRT